MRNSNLLQRLLLEQVPDAVITSSTSMDWSSISFSGNKHQLCLMFTSADKAKDFCEAIKDERLTVDLSPAKQFFCSIYIVDDDCIEPLGHSFITVEVVTLNEV